MIVKFAKSFCLNTEKSLKYISIEDTCPRLLHDACVGMANKPSFIQPFDFKIDYKKELF